VHDDRAIQESLGKLRDLVLNRPLLLPVIRKIPHMSGDVRLRRPMAGEDERQAKPDFVWTVRLAAEGGKMYGPGEAWSCRRRRHGERSRGEAWYE
jgi:hypothetical protein